MEVNPIKSNHEEAIMKHTDTQGETREIKMLGEYSAQDLSDEEINSVAGARWVSTVTTDSGWGPNPFCPCPDRDFIS